MTPSQLHKEIKKLYYQGTTRKEIIERFTQKGISKARLVKALKGYPSHASWEKHHLARHLSYASIALLAASFIFVALLLGQSLWYFFMGLGVMALFIAMVHIRHHNHRMMQKFLIALVAVLLGLSLFTVFNYASILSYAEVGIFTFVNMVASGTLIGCLWSLVSHCYPALKISEMKK